MIFKRGRGSGLLREDPGGLRPERLKGER